MRIRFLMLSGVMLGAFTAPGAAIAQVQPVCAPDTPATAIVSAAPPVTAPAAPTPTQTVVRDLERDEKGFPKWSNFPSAPQNVPTASDFKQRVSGIKNQEQVLESTVADLSWDLIDPAAYSAATRTRLNSDLSRPVTKNSCNETHQFALTQRAKAVPRHQPTGNNTQ